MLVASSLLEDDTESESDYPVRYDPTSVCTEILQFGDRKGQPCGGFIESVPLDMDYLGQLTRERVCQSCGTVYSSGALTEKPYNRKPTSSITFGGEDAGNLGTSHLALFDQMVKMKLIERLDNKKDAETYYGVRHVFSGSTSLYQRVINQGLELLSDAIERAGKKNDHRFANLAGKEYRKLIRKEFSKSKAHQVQLAQQFVSENRPSTNKICGMVAESIRRVDPSVLNRLKIKMNNSH